QWHANPEIRWAAVTLLGVLGNPVSATAIAAILPNEQEHGVYFAAVETLKKMPSAAVLSIEKLIRPSQSGVRQWNCPFAVETLAFVGGSTATHSIESFLDDPDPEFRRVAAAALGDLRETFSMPTLVEALRHDKDPEVRSEAAWALEKIGDRVESERKFLVTALAEVVERDRSSIVRVQVHDALMALGVVYGAGPGKVATGNSGEQLISETLRRDASNVCRQLFTFCLTGEVLYEDCINAFVLDWMVKQLRDRKHLDIKYTTLRDHLEKVQSLFAAHITDLAFLYDSGQGQHGYEITPQWDVAWHIAMRILERKQPINLDMRT
ncbi:MAG TPA: HEAT repeat domain-containing protein, partial [Gemmataceae bacterium]|nr:HEAT repeat domain-containing protein [Gemmataceae bacterium]